MNTEKTPTIYGTVTFEQFQDATETVCKYVEGLANTYTIKDLLTEEHRNKLEPDIIMGCVSMLRIGAAHGRLIDAAKGLQAELLEKKAAKERAAQAETNDPSEPAQAEPSSSKKRLRKKGLHKPRRTTRANPHKQSRATPTDQKQKTFNI